MKFKIGDRVIGISDWQYAKLVGISGVVIAGEDEDDEVGVQFDELINDGHSCSERGTFGYCYWVGSKSLKKSEKIEKVKENVNKQDVATVRNKPFYHHSTISHTDGSIQHLCELIEESSYKVIFNGNTTIVIKDDGSKGVAKCIPDDTYDTEKGMKIATLKAYIKSYQKELKRLTK